MAVAQFRQKKLTDAYQNMTHAGELAPSRDDIAAGLADISIAGYLDDPEHPAQIYSEAATAAADFLKRKPKSWDGLWLKGRRGAGQTIRRCYCRFPGGCAGETESRRSHAAFNGGSDRQWPGCGRGEGRPRVHRARFTFRPVYDTLYRWYTQSHNEGAAENLLKQKIAANPSVAGYRLQLAGYYLRTKNTPEMKTTLGSMAADAKRFPDGWMIAANFYAKNGLYDDAIAYINAGAKSGQDKTKYQQRKAEVLAQVGRPDQAMALLNGILKSDPKNVDARSLRAGIDMEDNKPERVQAALDELFRCSWGWRPMNRSGIPPCSQRIVTVCWEAR